jgi:hypothetical protein
VADQGKWFKLWCSSLHDEVLENLSLEDWARWARLGAYIKEHGKEGKIRFNPPYRALLNLLRMDKIEDAIVVLHEFPNFTVGERSFTVSSETNSPVSYEIEVKNWLKFQGDFSSDRVRKFRDKKRHSETLQEEKRRRREENKNRTPAFVRPTVLEIAAFAATEKLGIDAQRFFNYYEANGWKVGRNAMKDWRASARNWKSEGPFNAQTRKPANAFVADREEAGKYT